MELNEVNHCRNVKTAYLCVFKSGGCYQCSVQSGTVKTGLPVA